FCANSTTLSVTIKSCCTADIINKDTTICSGASVTLNANTAISDGVNSVTDIDGNTYPTVKIGNQTWTQKNLNVTKYRNGDIIPQVTDPTQWANLKTGAWCYYNNDPSTEATYGKLYNWYAVNDPRGIAPQGWHVPTDAEWNKLVKNIDPSADTACANCPQSSTAGGALKEAGVLRWVSPNTGATNSTGFTGLPGSFRASPNGSDPLGYTGVWWTSTSFNSTSSWYRVLRYLNGGIERNYQNPLINGYSVRALLNEPSYLWSNGATTSSITVTPTQATTYYLTVTDANGNSCKDSVKVTVTPKVTPTFTTIAPICQGATAPVLPTISTNGIAGTWSPAVVNTSTIGTATYTFTPSPNFCANSTTLSVTIKSCCTADIINKDTTICSGASVTLNANTAVTGGISSLPPSLTNGLVAYYPFNGNANDESGNGNNGTVNGATLTTDRFGNNNKAYSFNGNSKITVAHSNSLNVGSEMTISIWVKQSTMGNTINYILQKGTGGGCTTTGYYSAVDYGFGSFPNGVKVLGYGQNNNCASIGSDSSLNSSWHSVIFVYAPGSGNKLYIDGKSVDNQQYTTCGNCTILNSTNPLIIGGFLNAGNISNSKNWNGLIDDVAIYNRALSTSEIQQLYTTSSYLWSTGATTPSITVTPTQTTTYYLTVTDANGNSCKDSVKVTVTPKVTPTFTQIAAVCQGATFTLPTSSTNGISGSWSPAINTQTTTTYTFTPSAGQCANTATMTVEIKSCNPLSLIVSTVNGVCGNTVDVPVRVSGFKSMASMQGSINWNPADLKFESISNFGPASLALGNANFGTSQSTQGRLTFSWNDNNLSGITLPDTTTIYTIRFTALGSQSRTIPVTISNTPTIVEFVDVTLQKKNIVQVNGNVKLNCVSVISGNILTPVQQPVKNATVSLSGQGTAFSTTSDANGNYTFSVVPGTYTLTPSKNNEINRTNGVTTLDVALIQSHILQRSLLNSPYKIIAADVNASNTVTSLDLLFIRRFILGYETSFPVNRTWAFVPQDHVFANSQNPFPYPSSKTVSALGSLLNTNVVGLKLGDVNFDRNPQLDRPVNSTQALKLYYDEEIINDKEMILHVRVKEGKMLMGTQFTLNWDAGKYTYVGVVSNPLNISTGDRWISEGTLAMSWNDEQARGLMLAKDMELFSIRLTPTGNASLNYTDDILSLGNDKLEQEAFDGSYRNTGITLERSGKAITKDNYLKVYPNPAKDQLQLTYGSVVAGRGEIRLMDIYGNEVYRKVVQLQPGDNRYNLNLSGLGLSAGSYVLKLYTANSSKEVKVVLMR
ncbi:MAG: T9SS type A sorting domain-containing protein, partial [Ferruginibacter sp.]|nr:T9SS type A sorting domain-containing protein [Ferruginibacter sp.]